MPESWRRKAALDAGAVKELGLERKQNDKCACHFKLSAAVMIVS
jgi:hypothetical protein